MTGTDLLDAAIGVVFVILTFSIVASALYEALAGVLNWRGRVLRRGLFRLLEGAAGAGLVEADWLTPARVRRAGLTLDLLDDPSIRVLHGPRSLTARLWDWLADRWRGDIERTVAGLGRLPSAIPPESFARALVDTLARRIDLSAVRPEEGLSAANAGAVADAVRALAEDLAEEADAALRAADGALAAMALDPALRDRLRRAVGRLSVVRELGARLDRLDRAGAAARAELDRLAGEAEAGMEGLLTDLGDWFDRAMERVSGWYARRARVVLFALGAGMALAANLDLARFGQRVLGDAGLRAALVERAAMAEAPAAGAAAENDADIEETLAGVRGAVGAARAGITALPGHGGPGLGRYCADGEPVFACFRRTFTLSALLSWIVTGLGCMMGGQFWYDLLAAVLRLRPGGARRPA